MPYLFVDEETRKYDWSLSDSEERAAERAKKFVEKKGSFRGLSLIYFDIEKIDDLESFLYKHRIYPELKKNPTNA